MFDIKGSITSLSYKLELLLRAGVGGLVPAVLEGTEGDAAGTILFDYTHAQRQGYPGNESACIHTRDVGGRTVRVSGQPVSLHTCTLTATRLLLFSLGKTMLSPFRVVGNSDNIY
jgi:hypothetical protein